MDGPGFLLLEQSYSVSLNSLAGVMMLRVNPRPTGLFSAHPWNGIHKKFNFLAESWDNWAGWDGSRRLRCRALSGGAGDRHRLAEGEVRGLTVIVSSRGAPAPVLLGHGVSCPGSGQGQPAGIMRKPEVISPFCICGWCVITGFHACNYRVCLQSVLNCRPAWGQGGPPARTRRGQQ